MKGLLILLATFLTFLSCETPFEEEEDAGPWTYTITLEYDPGDTISVDRAAYTESGQLYSYNYNWIESDGEYVNRYENCPYDYLKVEYYIEIDQDNNGDYDHVSEHSYELTKDHNGVISQISRSLYDE